MKTLLRAIKTTVCLAATVAGLASGGGNLRAETFTIPGDLRVGGVIVGIGAGDTNTVISSASVVVWSTNDWEETFSSDVGIIGEVPSYYSYTLTASAAWQLEMSVNGTDWDSATPTNVPVQLRVTNVLSSLEGTNTITALTVYGYERTDLVGATNEFVGQYIGRDGSPFITAADGDVIDANDSDWSSFPATTTVQLNSQPLRFNSQWSMRSTNEQHVAIRAGGEDVMQFESNFGIGAYLWISGDSTNVVLTVSNGVALGSAMIQMSTNFVTPLWTTVTDYELSTNGDHTVYTIDAPTTTPMFYRAFGVGSPAVTVLANMTVDGTLTATALTGNGSEITNVHGTNIQAGTINSNKLDAATWAAAIAGGSAGISNVVEDLSPELGGALNAAGNDITNVATLVVTNLVHVGRVTNDFGLPPLLSGSSVAGGTFNWIAGYKYSAASAQGWYPAKSWAGYKTNIMLFTFMSTNNGNAFTLVYRPNQMFSGIDYTTSETEQSRAYTPASGNTNFFVAAFTNSSASAFTNTAVNYRLLVTEATNNVWLVNVKQVLIP